MNVLIMKLKVSLHLWFQLLEKWVNHLFTSVQAGLKKIKIFSKTIFEISFRSVMEYKIDHFISRGSLALGKISQLGQRLTA